MKKLRFLFSLFLALEFHLSSGNTYIVCYYASWARYRQGDGKFTLLANANPQLCTHMIYQIAKLDNATFEIKLNSDDDAKDCADFVSLKNQNSDLKIMISIGSWTDWNDGSGTYSALLNNTAHMKNFVASVVKFLQDHGYDGLDFNLARKEKWVKDGFVHLMADLKEAFKPKGHLLSAAFGMDYEDIVKPLADFIDFLNVCSYEYYGSWDRDGTVADHHAPFKKRPNEEVDKNVDDTITRYIFHGFPATKINVGIPLFGKSWILSSTVIQPPAPASGAGGTAGPFTKADGLLAYYEICNNTKANGWEVHHDPEGNIGPYAVSPGNSSSRVWVGYDDPAMAVKKFEYSVLKKLGSVVLSDVTLDDFRNICGEGPFPIMTAIKSASIRNGSNWKKVTGIVVSVLVTALCLGVLYFFFVYRRKGTNKFNYLGNLAQLLEGRLNEINPDLSLDGQAESLPYDSKWELPVESLLFEQQIGSGHYGRVVKARAADIGNAANEVEVAVKMVKSCVDLDELRSLVCELKVLVHLGSHLNVVNLLGAVTKNIANGSLMVVLEYCRNGNLKDFLVNNRRSFVSDIGDDGYLQPASDYVTISTKDPGTVSKETSQPKIEDSCETRDKRSPVVKTSDLIEWSRQIASGMNYLAKKKVIHGDLAARNVLLGDNNVVKIADFGLARKTYQNQIYTKKGTEAMPLKWMAIESITDRLFSSKSDVWSFGVTLWELFTLGQEPYAEVKPSQLLAQLKRGYRLQKPNYAPDLIYDMMSNCWRTDPDDRMTFELLEQSLRGQLDQEEDAVG